MILFAATSNSFLQLYLNYEVYDFVAAISWESKTNCQEWSDFFF